ncbi:MAG: hypothetical protein NWE93_10780 [Candidatus Bathyarchaeota archaeon]|nr:hypothetical protein [Candidatus Bathyarchaeota archaeon]
MKIKTKSLATLFAVLMIISTAIPLATLPTASAADASVKTFPFVGATPNPVGVNQQVLIHVGISAQLSTANLGWKDMSVTIIDPDGKIETITGINTDSTGGTGTVYTPTKVGNYTIQSHFPEQKMPTTAGGIAANTTMLASDSENLTLVVRSDPIAIYPGNPLPGEYWTRPINSQLREWYSISGSSWMSGNFNDGPTTPHVLWATELTNAGLFGGELGLVGSGGTSVSFENGDAYEGKWINSFILAGRLYYQDAPGTLRAVASNMPVVYHCVDLRTGEEYWAKTFLNNKTITFCQALYWESYNSQGVFAYLWVVDGTTWTAFDPYTGDWRGTITNVPTGTRITDEKGNVFLYNVNLNAGYMTLWNMTALISMEGSFGRSFVSTTINASATTGTARTAAQRAWAWNITIPKGLPGAVNGVALGEKVVGSSQNTTHVVTWAFSIDDSNGAPSGALLYKNVWSTPSEWTEGSLQFVTYGSSWCLTDLNENIGLIWMKELRKYYAFDLENGKFLWATEPEHYLNMYGPGRQIIDGQLVSYGYAGIVNGYDLSNGDLLWTYNNRDQYTEILWSSDWPLFCYGTSNELAYFFFMEHSGNQPLSRGAPTVCLNTTDGSVVWRADGLFRTTNWGGTPIMGDSVISLFNTYDQQVYAIGKGPSALTVTAPDVGISLGNSVVIKGAVTDISPGLVDNYAITARFPNGVPAVSDDSQAAWMQYVYQQFARPSNATGVDVSLMVLDSNNNVYSIGTATADASGTFGFSWTPEIPGQYTIYAVFEGSGAYYPSTAQTYINVEEPVEPTPTVTAQPISSVVDTYFLPSVVAIVIAIAIVGAVLLLAIKKRP